MDTLEYIREEIARRKKENPARYALFTDEEILQEFEGEKREEAQQELAKEDIERLGDLFDRQVETLLEKGYPQAARMSEERFLGIILSLKEKLPQVADAFRRRGQVASEAKDRIPFLIVVRRRLVPMEDQMMMTDFNGKNGITEYGGSSSIKNPQGLSGVPVYFAVDIEPGPVVKIKPSFKDVGDIGRIIKQEGRLGLSVEEGIALITHYPKILSGSSIIVLLGSSSPRFSDYHVLKLRYGRPSLEISFIPFNTSRQRIPSCAVRLLP